MDESQTDEVEVREVLGWAEFMCWAALVIAPVLWWVQGPSVSRDQFVVRTGLVVLAATGAVGLRLAALVRRFRSARRAAADQSPSDSPEPRTAE